MAKFAFGLWDLPGLLHYRYNSSKVRKIAPPIIEVYDEKDKPSQSPVWGLVDGLHRFIVAQKLGYDQVRALVALKVKYPLVPLPVEWDEIQEYQEMPDDEEKKRRYRYKIWSDVPNEIKRTFNINQINYKYFFYRDLRPIGSRGKRDFYEFKS
jgi:hypothetical protein